MRDNILTSGQVVVALVTGEFPDGGAGGHLSVASIGLLVLD